jgi:hypothetical protein
MDDCLASFSHTVFDAKPVNIAVSQRHFTNVMGLPMERTQRQFAELDIHPTTARNLPDCETL